jgi:hypothetical protein
LFSLANTWAKFFQKGALRDHRRRRRSFEAGKFHEVVQ